ncbi:MAG: 4Fe-4S dicluster domain-containing protein [Pseudomonadota bacterium]
MIDNFGTNKKSLPIPGNITRRDFLKYSGIAVISVGACGFLTSADGAPIPISQGYLLVDTKKCQGCLTCMLSCSLVHEGKENLSLSRIQVLQNPFEKYPDDIRQIQCRQCPIPACMLACDTGALHVDTANGNVRLVDYSKCNGCLKCIAACPYTPGRALWNFKAGHAQKCDLCVATPYWNEKGGPGGKQACVTFCPLKAIQFTSTLPAQGAPDGYTVNLRDSAWAALGYPIK